MTDGDGSYPRLLRAVNFGGVGELTVALTAGRSGALYSKHGPPAGRPRPRASLAAGRRAPQYDRSRSTAKPIDVNLSDIALNPELTCSGPFARRGVAALVLEPGCLLLTEMGGEALIQPMSDVRAVFDDESRKWWGRRSRSRASSPAT